MSTLQPVRGTKDFLPLESEIFRYINNTAFNTAKLYGYGEIHTPIFEFSNVFQKTLGETSDIVGKEMYSFTDRGGEQITLRPEGTAGIARSFISEGLAQQIPLKLYYCGPMFRYERPQKGRFRQFHQIGVECIGIPSAHADIECISLSNDIFKKFNLDKKVKLELNTLGDSQSREKHRTLLVEYLEKFKNDLSADSKIRLDKNPLRILDSKDANDQKILIDAPTINSTLTDESKKFFDDVCNGLIALDIPFEINNKLVRGLDYYTHTVFEWTTSFLGAQGTVLAGGRYDGLIKMMGGPATEGVGWASGIERLILLLEEDFNKNKITTNKIAVICADDDSYNYSLKVSQSLRDKNFIVEHPHSGNVGKKLKRADKVGCTWACIIGSTEVQNNSVTLKNLKTGDQNNFSLSDLVSTLLTMN